MDSTHLTKTSNKINKLGITSKDRLSKKEPVKYTDGLSQDAALLANKRAKIITITSGKGGVGKSSISVNLGLALIKAGKKVLLFEADLGLANINVLMGVIPKYNLYHLIRDQKQLKDIILHTPEGLDIIPGASGYSSLADMSNRDREQIIGEFESLDKYDIILIDTGAGISSSVVSFTLPADEIIVVTTPEPTSITDAYGIIKSIVLINSKKRIKLIVNRASSSLEGRKVAERLVSICDQFLNYKIISHSFIFNDENVGKAVRSQKPFFILYPKGKASSCLNIITAKMLGQSVEDSQVGSSVGGVFRKLFQTH